MMGSAPDWHRKNSTPAALVRRLSPIIRTFIRLIFNLAVPGYYTFAASALIPGLSLKCGIVGIGNPDSIHPLPEIPEIQNLYVTILTIFFNRRYYLLINSLFIINIKTSLSNLIVTMSSPFWSSTAGNSWKLFLFCLFVCF